MTTEKRNMWIGIGVGAAMGIGTGYLVGSHITKKRCRKEYDSKLKKARRSAYIEGVNDGIEEGRDPVREKNAYEAGFREGLQKADELIDQCCVIAHEGDTPEDIQRRVIEKQKEIDAREAAEKAAAAEQKKPNIPETHTGSAPEVRKIGMAEYDSERHQVVFLGSGGTRISYPANLFIGPDGDILDSIDIRNNIRKHEHNKARLNLIWSQMGWGAYIPDLDGEVNEPPTAAEINNWDLNLDGETGQADDDEGLLLGDEPEEKTKERERYLDEVDRYRAHPEDAPRIISRREFGEEAYLDRVDVDYYDVENIFVESTDMDNKLDAYEYFGVTNGNDLFRMKNDADDDDPDTVYVKNFRMNCVMEVTRLHKSYESVKNGGAYIQDGRTD